jgi:preprotein translocase subunit SecG
MVFALGWACLVPPSTFDAYTMLVASVAMFVLVLVHASAANRAVRIAGGSRRAGRGEPLRRIALVLSVAMLAGLVGARGAVMH